MLGIFISSIILLTFVQTDSPSFYVEVNVLSEYNARHIFAYTSLFFPADKPVTETETPRKVNCLINELKASGIYEDVRVEMRPSSRDGVRLLEVSVVYHQDIKNLVIGEITSLGFPEVPTDKFKARLSKKGVRPGVRFLKYNYGDLTEKIVEALREAFPKRLIREDDDRPAWFIIRPAGDGKINLTISSTLPKCEIESQAGGST